MRNAEAQQSDRALAELRERVAAARAAGRRLRLRGSGTKDFYGESLAGEIVDTRAHAGVVSYQPSELVFTARCGTLLSEIDATLAEHGQYLACEPPRFAGDPTLGGIVAAGLSGPRRMQAGAVRDFVLGATLLTAGGELLRFGGTVIKNVAGFDVSRLLCGSLGTLGIITEISMRVMPRPAFELTLRLEMSADAATASFNRWAGQPLPISATAWLDENAWVRLSGAESAIRAAQSRIGGQQVDKSEAGIFWRSLRDQTHRCFGLGTDATLWRVSVPTSAATLRAEGERVVEWNGGIRWLRRARGDDPRTIRSLAASLGGTAMQWAGARGTRFHPLEPEVDKIHRRLKQEFDPLGIFNPGRLLADF